MVRKSYRLGSHLLFLIDLNRRRAFEFAQNAARFTLTWDLRRYLSFVLWREFFLYARGLEPNSARKA